MDCTLPRTSHVPNTSSPHYSPPLQPHFRSATNLSHTSTEINHACAFHTTANSSSDQPRSEATEYVESNVKKNVVGQLRRVRPVRVDKSDANLNCGTRNGWDDNPTLRRLDAFYPLARTHMKFEISELPSILRRIENGFRALSLDVLYNRCPISAVCTSLERVKISIQFWESRERVGTQRWGIVEIIRIAGDTIVSHRYIRQLLKRASGDGCDHDAIHTNDSSSSSSSLLSSSMSSSMNACCCGVTGRAMGEGNRRHGTLRIDSLVRLAYVDDARRSRDVLLEAMDVASSMLRLDRRDGRQLGLESLIALTDPGKVGTDIAAAAARCILTGSNGHNGQGTHEYDGNEDRVDCANLRDRILELALTGRWPEEKIVPRDDEDDRTMSSRGGSGGGDCTLFPCGDDADGEGRSGVWFLAWNILVQALNVASASDVNAFLRDADRHCGESFGFVHHLLSGIQGLDDKRNDGRPSIHMVFFHTACLEVICRHIPAIKSTISLNQVQQVQQYGMLHHAALSQAADHLTRILITPSN